MNTESRSLTILQVEDTPSDAILTAHALREGPVQHSIHVVGDGNKALVFLKRGEGFADCPRPDLIILDLSLPGLNGHEVLDVIKKDESLRTIPVVVFTTLDTVESLRLAYEQCANSYIVKPLGLAEFTKKVQSIASYWSETCLPAPSRPAQRVRPSFRLEQQIGSLDVGHPSIPRGIIVYQKDVEWSPGCH
jgi:CheY-like chemotaxis protein